MEPMKLELFLRGYLECAVWSSTDDDGGPLDKDKSIYDFSEEAIEQARKDCDEFQEYQSANLYPYDLETAGHDFWLTRNGHGAGFWDGDYPEHGDKLTEASKTFGELNLYVGDDGRLYFF